MRRAARCERRRRIPTGHSTRAATLLSFGSTMMTLSSLTRNECALSCGILADTSTGIGCSGMPDGTVAPTVSRRVGGLRRGLQVLEDDLLDDVPLLHGQVDRLGGSSPSGSASVFALRPAAPASERPPWRQRAILPKFGGWVMGASDGARGVDDNGCRSIGFPGSAGAGGNPGRGRKAAPWVGSLIGSFALQ